MLNIKKISFIYEPSLIVGINTYNEKLTITNNTCTYKKIHPLRINKKLTGHGWTKTINPGYFDYLTHHIEEALAKPLIPCCDGFMTTIIITTSEGKKITHSLTCSFADNGLYSLVAVLELITDGLEELPFLYVNENDKNGDFEIEKEKSILLSQIEGLPYLIY